MAATGVMVLAALDRFASTLRELQLEGAGHRGRSAVGEEAFTGYD